MILRTAIPILSVSPLVVVVWLLLRGWKRRRDFAVVAAAAGSAELIHWGIFRGDPLMAAYIAPTFALLAVHFLWAVGPRKTVEVHRFRRGMPGYHSWHLGCGVAYASIAIGIAVAWMSHWDIGGAEVWIAASTAFFASTTVSLQLFEHAAWEFRERTS